MATPVVADFRLPPLIPQQPLVDPRTGMPTQFFIDYMNTLNEKLTSAVNALNTAVDTLTVARDQSIASQQSVVVAAQSVAVAQASADVAAGSPAQSGDALLTLSVPESAGWTAGPQVDLAGVAAGNLTIINSGPNQVANTEVGRNGLYTGNWRVQEIILGVESTVFTGTFTAQRARDDVGLITLLWNDTDTAAFSLARASVGLVSYRLDLSSPDVDVDNVQAYLYARRG